MRVMCTYQYFELDTVSYKPHFYIKSAFLLPLAFLLHLVQQVRMTRLIQDMTIPDTLTLKEPHLLSSHRRLSTEAV